MKKKKIKRSPLKGFKILRLHHKIIFTFIGVLGVVLVWRGIWNIFDNLPVLNNPLISVFFGFLLVVLSGIFFKLI
ncbi:MAG: hypothetical protein Q8P10_02535 [bacterium]|nr:hypothetical protein [bacterium]